MAEGNRGSQIGFQSRGCGVGVYEIDPGFVSVIRKKRTRVLTSKLSPAHMGDPFTLAAGQFGDGASQKAKPYLIALITALE